MFAIDGVQLPSNASKHRSGTRADVERQADKLEAAAATMLARHRATDTAPFEPDPDTNGRTRIETLARDAAQMRAWLARNPDERRSANGAIRKSNRTDNASAKMATSTGVIHGYTGVAAVDATHQIIVDAHAHGTGSEQGLLMPVITAVQSLRTAETLITADALSHSEANLAQLATMRVPALIADNDMRRRDERFATKHAIPHCRIRCTTNRTRPQRRRRRASRHTILCTMRTRAPVPVQRGSPSLGRGARI